MGEQEAVNFQRIAKAITFIKAHLKEQPSLSVIANHVNMSEFHFQRVFSDWAGVSPKKFMQYLSLDYAKQVLHQGAPPLLTVAHKAGLSGTGRLHDLFVNIEGMTPGEYKKGGQGLTINYSFGQSPFGQLVVAATKKGVCQLFFEEDECEALKALQARFPNALYQQKSDALQRAALAIYQKDWQQLTQIKLHLAGTHFQLKVWESLLKIPMGHLKTYGDVALSVGNAKAARAVGSAIGKNPVAFLIPCHRVIQATGNIGGYMWGAERKTAMLGWEAAKAEDHSVPPLSI